MEGEGGVGGVCVTRLLGLRASLKLKGLIETSSLGEAVLALLLLLLLL